jgi:hypothetical protein
VLIQVSKLLKQSELLGGGGDSQTLLLYIIKVDFAMAASQNGKSTYKLPFIRKLISFRK